MTNKKKKSYKLASLTVILAQKQTIILAFSCKFCTVPFSFTFFSKTLLILSYFNLFINILQYEIFLNWVIFWNIALMSNISSLCPSGQKTM